jgi:hypothetical protein
VWWVLVSLLSHLPGLPDFQVLSTLHVFWCIGIVNLELGVCWKQCPSPSRVGFGVIDLELGVCCKGCPSLSSRVGFGVVTLELGVCLTQCLSLRKNGLNVLCLELGVCWLQCWCLSRVSFGVLNHRSYLWCRFVRWTTCMLGTIYTYLIPLVLFSFQLVMQMYNTRKHVRIQILIQFVSFKKKNLKVKRFFNIILLMCMDCWAVCCPMLFKKKWSGRGRNSHAHTPHQKWWKVWLIVVDVGIVIHLKFLMEFIFLDLVSLGVNNFVNKCLCVCFSSFIFFYLVNFVSGTLFLMKAHSHKVIRSTTKLLFF